MALSDAEWDYDGDVYSSSQGQEEVPPPSSPGLLPRIASVLGFNQQNRADDDAESGGVLRRLSRGSFAAHSRASMSSRRRMSDASYKSSEENWGYSSNEEDYGSEDGHGGDGSFHSSLADDTSLPPQSRPSSPIPLMGTDMFFGENGEQLPVQQFEENEALGSRQTINLPDEDLTIRFTGYITHTIKSVVWLMGCIASFGILGLIGRWVPNIWVKACGQERDFNKAGSKGWLVVETPYGDLHIVPQTIVPYPYPVSTVFPSAAAPIAAKSSTRAPTPATGSKAPSITTAAESSSSGTAAAAKPIGTSVGGAMDLISVDLEQGTHFEKTMGFLQTAEYRYTKFALHPVTGRWCMVRDWRDPRWTGIKAVASGLNEETRVQRRVLFGDNVVDIEGKGTISLLLDEVGFVKEGNIRAPFANVPPPHRSSIHSTSFKSPPSSSGLSTIITTMPLRSPLSVSRVSCLV